MIALIDADIIKHKMAYWAFTKGISVLDAYNWSIANVQEILEILKLEDCICVWSGPQTTYFRHDIYPDYKGIRNKKENPYPPEYIDAAMQGMLDTYECLWRINLEADDVLGIFHTDPNLDTILVSDDKDMLTIPGTHYNPRKDLLMTISPEQADYHFCLQWLMGDSVDGFCGIPKVGIKTAEKILKKGCCWYGSVLQAYEEYADRFDGRSWVDEVFLMGRLARILRYEEWNHERFHYMVWTWWANPTQHFCKDCLERYFDVGGITTHYYEPREFYRPDGLHMLRQQDDGRSKRETDAEFDQGQTPEHPKIRLCNIPSIRNI